MIATASLLLCTLAGATIQNPQSHAGEAKPNLLDTVVAKVGDTTIRLADIKAEVNRIVPLEFFHARLPEEQKKETYQKAFDSLVEKALIQQDARLRGIEIDDDALHEEFHKTLSKAGPQYENISDEQFEDLLQNYRPLVVRRLLIDRNEARFQASLPAVTDEMVRERYEKEKDQLQAPVEARFLHILAKVAPSAGQAEAMAVRQELEKLRVKIEEGAAFEELAKQYSDDIYASQGGDMGFIAKGAFQIGELNDAAFALKDGEVSQVLSSLYGFHLLKRVETKPARLLKFEEAAPRLREALQLEIQEKARKAWIESMKQAIGVEILVQLDDDLVQAEE